MSTKKIVKADIVGGTAVVEPQFEVDRHGAKLCTANSYAKLHDALYQCEELEETVVSVKLRLECYPLDGIVQMNRAIHAEFGHAHAKGEEDFFGRTPPMRLSIEVAYKQFETFAYGKLQPPAWEGGWIQMSVDMQNPMSLMIVAQVKRKFEPSIKKVLDVATRFIKEKSIYRGAAVELDLDYLDDIQAGKTFNPEHCAPRFIDLSEPVTLILPRDLEMLLENKIWGPIEKPDDYVYNGVKVKRGFILSGPYGTGKTLISLKTAYIAADNDWTFFYLKTPKHFVQGYRLAQIYARSIYFIEDIDAIFGGKRTTEMNMILETMDGLASKHSEIITVFTTNFPERINQAFKRSGRIDKEIPLRRLDAEAAGRFIKTFCGAELATDVNYDEVGVAFRDLVPADIRGGVDEAKEQAIRRFGRDIHGKITTEILVTAGEIMRRERAIGSDGTTDAERSLGIVRAAHRIVADGDKVASAAK